MFNPSQALNILLPNDSSLKKRERTQNWNQEEKERLLELCRMDVQIIENKRYDARHTEAKSKIWQLIHQNFSKQFGSERSVNRLKEQWRRMKAAARSEMQDYRKRLQQQCNNNLIENKKPTEFSYKVCDLLDEANRLCEHEIPIKSAECHGNISETNNSFLFENNEIRMPMKAPDASAFPDNVIEKDKTCYIDKDNIDMKLDEAQNINESEENAINNNEFDSDDGGGAALNQSTDAEFGDNIDDSMQSDDSVKGTSSDCSSDIDNESNKRNFSDGCIYNTEKSCCTNFITKMKHKEHVMRMKILKAQLKQLMRSKELLEMCKIGMENTFINSIN